MKLQTFRENKRSCLERRTGENLKIKTVDFLSLSLSLSLSFSHFLLATRVEEFSFRTREDSQPERPVLVSLFSPVEQFLTNEINFSPR